MSIKLMKQRWLVEEVDDKKDSTEIVDMDVDKDEYEIISEMEKPIFLTQTDVENEEPETIGINMRTQGNAVGAEVKRLSRWDVGAPFCIQLNDALGSNTNEIIVKKYSTLDHTRSEAYNKMISGNEREEIFTNKANALKIVDTEMERCVKNIETSVASEHEYNQNRNCADLSLEKIALPSDSCDVALPFEPSALCGDAGYAHLSNTAEDKLASEAMLDKGKVIIKWKFMKTPKELPNVNVKIWDPDVAILEPSKLHPEEQVKSTMTCAESSVDRKTVTDNLDSDICESSFHTKVDLREIILPPCSPEPNASGQSHGSTASSSDQNQSYHVMHEMQLLKNQSVEQKIVQEKTNEEYSTSNKILGSNCNTSETVFSCSKLHYNHDLGKNSMSMMDDESAADKEIQRTVTPWFTMHLPQDLHLEEMKLPSDSVPFLQQQWRIDDSKTETSGEGEQGSSLSTVSSATSISTYSFNSAVKADLSSNLGILRITNEQKQLLETSDTVSADLIDSINDEPSPSESALVLDENERELDVSVSKISPILLKPASQPAQYEYLDENIVLCDESLIKEAKVVRCFCEPTSVEIAEGRGCSSGCINRELYTECGSRCPSGIGCANRRFQNKQYAKVEIFNAGVKGWGLRAAEPLEPGRFIIEYVGEIIDAEEVVRRGRRYGKDPKHVHHYLMALKNGAVIDATAKGNVSRFINHSCDPNCESQKWTVNRQLRVGFFVIKPIAIGEEIVFDYQLERYGRKAQRCFCGAANCRGRIGDDSESEEEEEDKISDEAEAEESGTDDEVLLAKRKLKSEKKEKSSRIMKKRKKQPSLQRCNKAIMNALSRGPPRNRTQVRDLVRLMVQVEQAPQRSSLIQCIRFAHPDVLRLFIQESGLRLLYVFLATDYPIDDEHSVLQLQIKSLDLLDVMPIMNKNQVIDSHLASTVEKIASKKGPVDEIVEDVVKRLVDAVCYDLPSTSKHSASTISKDPDSVIERLHYEMVAKATKLMRKWRDLREEYRIPRRERTDPVPAQYDVSRYVRKTDDDEKNKRVIVDKKDDGSTLWRLSGFGPPPKRRYFDRRRLPRNDLLLNRSDLPIFVKDLTHLKNEDFKQSPTTVIDASRVNDDDEGENRPKKRRTRFDIVGERNPSSMYELYAADCDSYAPPPPKLLPEALFASGLPDSINFPYSEHPFPEFFDWNTVYAKYDPSSAAYQQFIDYYQQQQYPMMGMLPFPLTSQSSTEMRNILEAPSPPPPKRPKTPEENPNMLIIGPIDMENPTDEDIEMLEKHLVALKAKRTEIRKRLQDAQNKAAQESNEMSGVPPPPPPSHIKQSLWVQATTEEGAVYYYNKETRESVWTLPDESEGGNASADTTTDRADSRAAFKVEIVKYVGGMLEPIRKLKFASADDYKYVLRKLTHTILEKELKRVGETELKVTESVRDKARKFVAEYLARLGDGQYSRKNKVHNSY